MFGLCCLNAKFYNVGYCNGPPLSIERFVRRPNQIGKVVSSSAGHVGPIEDSVNEHVTVLQDRVD